MGGGIGGGSSNAATTLVALNYMWQTGLSDDQLAEIGLALRADVPVFTRGFAAFAEGVGEELSAVEPEENGISWFALRSASRQRYLTHPQLLRTRQSVIWQSFFLPRTKTIAKKLSDHCTPRLISNFHGCYNTRRQD